MKICVGDKVKLTPEYTQYATHQVREAFAEKDLRVEDVKGEVIRLHNGQSSGLNCLTVISPNWLIRV